MSRFVPLLVLTVMLAGCDVVSTLTEGMQQVKAVETDLEQSTGVKPEVGFNWHNGRLTLVTVQFPPLYQDKPLNDLAGLVRGTVVKDFKQTPERIVLSFALDK
jgi:hypothetical protein